MILIKHKHLKLLPTSCALGWSGAVVVLCCVFLEGRPSLAISMLHSMLPYIKALCPLILNSLFSLLISCLICLIDLGLWFFWISDFDATLFTWTTTDSRSHTPISERHYSLHPFLICIIVAVHSVDQGSQTCGPGTNCGQPNDILCPQLEIKTWCLCYPRAPAVHLTHLLESLPWAMYIFLIK